MCSSSLMCAVACALLRVQKEMIAKEPPEPSPLTWGCREASADGQECKHEPDWSATHYTQEDVQMAAEYAEVEARAGQPIAALEFGPHTARSLQRKSIVRCIACSALHVASLFTTCLAGSWVCLRLPAQRRVQPVRSQWQSRSRILSPTAKNAGGRRGLPPTSVLASQQSIVVC